MENFKAVDNVEKESEEDRIKQAIAEISATLTKFDADNKKERLNDEVEHYEYTIGMAMANIHRVMNKDRELTPLGHKSTEYYVLETLVKELFRSKTGVDVTNVEPRSLLWSDTE